MQDAPLLQEALRQIEAFARDRHIDALLHPSRIGLWIDQPVDFIGEHLHGLVALPGSQEAVERQLRVFTAFGRLFGGLFQRQVNLGGTSRLLASQVPLRGRLEGIARCCGSRAAISS